MINILFVCTANRFRSVIAAATLRTLAEKDASAAGWKITSAGTWTIDGLPPVPEAVSFAEKRGLDVSAHCTREVSKAILEASDLIIVMTEGQRESLELEFGQQKGRVHLLSEIFAGETYDIPDPFEKLEDTPESIGAEIYNLVRSGYPRLVGMIQQMGNV